jgi:hypothetical protein
MERKMVRVVFKLERGGAGNGPAWWAAFKPSDAEIVGEGSGRKVVIKKNAEPRWGPKPDGVRTYLSRRLGKKGWRSMVGLGGGDIVEGWSSMQWRLEMCDCQKSSFGR